MEGGGLTAVEIMDVRDSEFAVFFLASLLQDLVCVPEKFEPEVLKPPPCTRSSHWICSRRERRSSGHAYSDFSDQCCT